MISLFQAVWWLCAVATSVAGAGLIAKRQSSSFSSQQFTWYAPGNPYNGYVVQFVWPYGTVWVANASLGAAYVDLAFTVDTQHALISHSKTLCLLDPGQSSGYWVGDPTVFQDHPACKSGNNWGLYRGAYLTLGGGYDMFCLFTNSGGDALALWVPGIPAYEQGGSPCANRGRISVNGFSVQPAPATPVAPTSSVSMKPTTPPTTTPTTPPTTTTANKPNPTITSLVSTASSYISLASVAASSYTANATNSGLAKAAETAIENAITYVYDAMDASNDFSASSVAKKLDNTAEQLFKAAVALLAAEAVLTAAAASAFAAALGPVAALLSSAASAANDPAQNPSPSPSKTTSTTTSTSPTPYVCTICIACADSSLAQPTSTDEPEKRDLSGSLLTLGDIDDIRLDSLYSTYKRSEAKSERSSWHSDQILVRSANFCPSISITVPDYESYHSAGTGLRNPYTNYYNYFQDASCGEWQYKSLAGQSPNFITPQNSRVPDSNNYATEHIYEIQSVRLFFEYAVANDPILKQMYSSYNAFCGGLGRMMSNNGQFSQYPYNYNDSPIKQIYSQLQNMASEFVYLETKLNGMKGILFGTRNPSTQAEYQAALAYASRIYIVEDYLTRPEISSIYKRVSARIREAIHQFGQACNDTSASAPYRQFGNINWYSLYDRWESSYLDDVQEIMRAAALGNANSALVLIQARILNRGLSRVERNDFTKLRVYVQSNEGILGIISLNSLRR